MASENNGERSLMEKLRHTYRLVIMNNETFEEMGSYRLSLLNFYIILSTLVVLSGLLVLALIIFTPLKSLIPGYGDTSDKMELLELRQTVDELEIEMKAQEAYTTNFRKILVGDIENYDEVPLEESEMPDSMLNVNRIKEDEWLRKEVELGEKIQERGLLSKSANYVPQEVSLEQIYFIPPVNGMISEDFQLEKQHYGVDVMAPKNTPIKAIMDGYIITSDWTLETGNTIGIQHGNGLISFYKHNSALLAKAGSYVKAGEAVAIIGNTGTLSDGPHLHFELWHDGKPVNPSDYIKFD